jgi:hypothetical protein
MPSPGDFHSNLQSSSLCTVGVRVGKRYETVGVRDSIGSGVADGYSVGVSTVSGAVDGLEVGSRVGLAVLEGRSIRVAVGAASQAGKAVQASMQSVRPMRRNALLIVAFAFHHPRISLSPKAGPGFRAP